MTQPAIDPFDPALASSRALVVPVGRVLDPLGNVPHDPWRVETYKTDMAAGARFPPIAVVRVGSHYLVADGHKRLQAFAAFTPTEICVDVWSWTIWFSDQWRQARHHVAKQKKVMRLGLTSPREATRLWLTTFSHWGRVARSLAMRAQSKR